MPRTARHLGLLALLAAALVLGAWVDSGASQPALNEAQVKALYLFNFAKFVEWPAGAFATPAAPITIAVLGNDPVAQALGEVVKDKAVAGRGVAIRRLGAGDSPAGTHVLFVGRNERARVAAILAQVGTAPILTVGEIEEFVDQGGMINFVRVDDSIRFEIHPQAAERRGLKLSAKLLAVARVVSPREREGR